MLPSRPPEITSLEQAKELITALWGLVDANHQLQAENKALRSEVDELKVQVKELLDKAGKSSRNSSKSPSSDSIAQRANRPKKKRSSRNKGAQPGHEAHQRDLLEESKVDQFERHFPQTQCTCGGTVVVEQDPSFRHQVFDLPEVRYTITEHQVYDGVCDGCQQRHKGHWPDSIPSGQMGPGLIAWIVMMSAQFHLSVRQTQSLLAEQWGLVFSTGAVSEAQGKALPWLGAHYRKLNADTHRKRWLSAFKKIRSIYIARAGLSGWVGSRNSFIRLRVSVSVRSGGGLGERG